MIRSALNTFRKINLKLSFSISESEGRLALKRQKQAKLAQKIKEALSPSYLKVDDITIGNSCGQMYNITVQSDLFKGKSLVQQHQMVTSSISDDLKNIHGYNLKTKVPEQQAQTLVKNEKRDEVGK